MLYAICHNQQQINVIIVMVQPYFSQNCIEYFKGFSSLYVQVAKANVGANDLLFIL